MAFSPENVKIWVSSRGIRTIIQTATYPPLIHEGYTVSPFPPHGALHASLPSRASCTSLFFGSGTVPGDGCSSGAFCVFCRVFF